MNIFWLAHGCSGWKSIEKILLLNKDAEARRSLCCTHIIPHKVSPYDSHLSFYIILCRKVLWLLLFIMAFKRPAPTICIPLILRTQQSHRLTTSILCNVLTDFKTCSKHQSQNLLWTHPPSHAASFGRYPWYDREQEYHSDCFWKLSQVE